MSDSKFWVFPVARWTVVQADAHGHANIWLNPGWYRRETRGGVYKFTPITGWRYVAHRVLWGFDRLVDAR